MSSNVTFLHPNRVSRIKAAYATRRVPRAAIATLISGDAAPESGGLVLSRVEKIGQHRNVELANGRRARLFEGDEILLCFGNRYAPDQFEAAVPQTLGSCHMVAAGGIAARMVTRSKRIKNATAIRTLGLIGDRHGRPINLADHKLPRLAPHSPLPTVLAVAGTAMNAGKTETVVNLVKGLVHAGFKVGTAKVTGTGAGGDVWAVVDAGADPALDFTDMGLPSTYKIPLPEIECAATSMLAHLSNAGVDAIVLEVADGLFQLETSALLSSKRFTSLLDGVLFASVDAMGASGGVAWLSRHGLPIMGLSGALTQSPLATREASGVTGLPVFDMEALRDPANAERLVQACHRTERAQLQACDTAAIGR